MLPHARISNVSEKSEGDPSTEVESALLKLVTAKADEWCRELMDFTKRNRLLYFRHLKKGTLDLADANQSALDDLVAGRQVSLRKLFSFADDKALSEFRDRVRIIQAKRKENEEERSIETLHLALGEVTWDETGGSGNKIMPDSFVPPAAPLILIPLKISTSQGREDYVFTASIDDYIVNPVLVEFLKAEMKFDLLPKQDEETEDEPGITEILPLLKNRLSGLRGSRVRDLSVIANFTYAKLAMVQDIQDDLLAMSQHKMIQALCSVREAIESIRGHYVDPPLDAPNRVPPADEFLVLDADSSQNRIINAIIERRSFAFDGPPGTGKSQTIANAIGAMVARGYSVLFVAEKRAAIDVVIRRLNDVGLGDLVMDYHGTGHKKKELLDKIRTVLPLIQQSDSKGYKAPELESSRKRLVEHSDKLHSKLPNIELSPYELLCKRSEHAEIGDVGFVLPGASELTIRDVESCERNLRLFDQQGGFIGGRGAAAWRRLTDRDVRSIDEYVEQLNRIRVEVMPSIEDTEQVLAGLNLGNASTVPAAIAALPILASILDVQDRFGYPICVADITRLRSQLSGANGIVSGFIRALFSGSARSGRNEVRLLTGKRLSTRKASLAVEEVSECVGRWTSLGMPASSAPDVSGNGSLRRIAGAWKKLDGIIREVSVFPELNIAAGESIESIQRTVKDLLSFTSYARMLTQARTSEKFLVQQGMERLIEIARERGLGVEAICSSVWLSWLDSYIERDALSVLRPRSAELAELRTVSEIFAHHDAQHIAKTPRRILQAWRENYRLKAIQFKEQERALAMVLNKKRKVPPLKDIFRNSQDVICAIKPVWVMSPLSVSMLRPKAGSFDVVIFDEASQILPWDAVTAIKASRQVVVAGDDQQLPPTTFFAGSDREEEADMFEDEGDNEAHLQDFESILAFMKSVVTRPVQLQWHYRSRDERLINYSNKKIYQSLITFADSSSDSVLRFVRVPDGPDTVSKNASNIAEVRTVCDLIEEHAALRPHESLGVIALGTNHADAIDAELRRRRETNETLDVFLQAHSEEPFFVKNLERVQGDERDAIILTVGYGRGPDKQMRYTFGPINQKYGVRRLNVATTRSKNRMTVVATFGSDELRPEMCSAGGLEFLRGYLQYAESGGSDLGSAETSVEMNAFERSIFNRLSAAGLEVEPQYGVGRYRIDFAVRSRLDKSKFALAVECDGASYHSQPTARERDRLRQAALERRGWKFHRIWSTDWFNDPDSCVDSVLASLAVAETT